MPLDVKHQYVSAIPDTGDDSIVQGSNWNEAHNLTQAGATLLGRGDATAGPTLEVALDPATMAFTLDGKLAAVMPAGGTGTVTTLSVVTANGLAGTVASATTTPEITLSTTITGLLKGDGTAISAAAAGTDYVSPGGLTTTLASYLPLTGGTLSGNLNGTTADFSGAFEADNLNAASGSSGYKAGGTALLTRTASYTSLYDAKAVASLVLGHAGDTSNYYRQTTHLFQDAAGGNTTLTIVPGTSATFAAPLTLTGALNLASTTVITWGAQSKLLNNANGILHLTNNAGTAGIRLDASTDAVLSVNTTAGGAATLSTGSTGTVNTGTLNVTSTGTVQWGSRGKLVAFGDGVFHLFRNDGTVGTRFDVSTADTLFLGSTPSGAANTINNGSAGIILSGSVEARNTGFVSRGGTASAAGSSAQYFIKASSTANFGIFYGTGAPTFAAAVNSLYVRSDASAANTRLYVCTVAAGTWAAVTTP